MKSRVLCNHREIGGMVTCSLLSWLFSTEYFKDWEIMKNNAHEVLLMFAWVCYAGFWIGEVGNFIPVPLNGNVGQSH